MPPSEPQRLGSQRANTCWPTRLLNTARRVAPSAIKMPALGEGVWLASSGVGRGLVSLVRWHRPGRVSAGANCTRHGCWGCKTQVERLFPSWASCCVAADGNAAARESGLTSCRGGLGVGLKHRARPRWFRQRFRQRLHHQLSLSWRGCTRWCITHSVKRLEAVAGGCFSSRGAQRVDKPVSKSLINSVLYLQSTADQKHGAMGF